MVVRRAPRRTPLPAPRCGRGHTRAAHVAVPVDDVRPHDDAAYRPPRGRERDLRVVPARAVPRRDHRAAPLLLRGRHRARDPARRRSRPACAVPGRDGLHATLRSRRALGRRAATVHHRHDVQPHHPPRRGGAPVRRGSGMGCRHRGGARRRPGTSLRLRLCGRRRLGGTPLRPRVPRARRRRRGCPRRARRARAGPPGGRRDAPPRDGRPRAGAGRPGDDRVRE